MTSVLIGAFFVAGATVVGRGSGFAQRPGRRIAGRKGLLVSLVDFLVLAAAFARTTVVRLSGAFTRHGKSYPGPSSCATIIRLTRHRGHRKVSEARQAP